MQREPSGELGNQGDGGESVGKGGRVNVNAKSRASGVSAQQSVESTTESDTGDSVQTRKVPGQLGLVDVEMGEVGRRARCLLRMSRASAGVVVWVWRHR